MTRFRKRWGLIPLLFLCIFVLFPTDVHPATKKRRTASRSVRRPPPPPLETAKGATLEERLGSLLSGTVAQNSDVSAQIVEVESGQLIAERNPRLVLSPASNMKLFTTGAAIDLLKPTFEVTTTVFVRGEVDPAGTLTGDVKVVGHGDPTIGGRFHDGHSTAVLEEWITDLKRAGVKSIHGNLIFE